MNRQATIQSDLICSLCGNKMIIQRKQSKPREKYHIKDLYCTSCDKITKHIEVRDLSILKKELEFKLEFEENLNEMEKMLYNLINIESDAKQK